MKQTIDKLYNFIAKLLLMLEEELDELHNKKSKTAANVRKNITDSLNKLVNLIIQLNKLSKDDTLLEKHDISSEDQEIIERFISRYNNDS